MTFGGALAGRETSSSSILLWTVLTMAVCTVAIALHSLEIGMAVAIVPLLFVLVLLTSLPEAATLLAIFLLYTNVGVVAVEFHGAPALTGIVVPLLLLVPLGHSLLRSARPVIITPLLPLAVLHLVLQAAASLLSAQPEACLKELATFLGEGVVLYFLVTNAVRTESELGRVIWTLLLAGTALGGLSLWQYVTSTYDCNYWGFAQTSNTAFTVGTHPAQPRLAGPIGEKNYYAQFMLMLVPLGLMRLQSERSRILRGLAGVATCCTAVGAALTFSRGAAVALAVLVVFMLCKRQVRVRHIAILACCGVVFLVAVPQYFLRLTSVLRIGNDHSHSPFLANADMAARGRMTEMLSAALVFADHPLLGVGPGLFKYYYPEYAESVGIRAVGVPREAHNCYLDVAAETGATGAVCFLAVLILTMRRLGVAQKRCATSAPELAGLASGLQMALIAFMAAAFFLSLAYIRYLWLFLGLAETTSYLAAKRVRESLTSDSGRNRSNRDCRPAHDDNSGLQVLDPRGYRRA